MPLIQPSGHTRLVPGGVPLAHCEKSAPMPGAAIATPPTEFICTTTCDSCVETVKLSEPRNIVGMTAITATNTDKARLLINALMRRETLSWFISYYLSFICFQSARAWGLPATGIKQPGLSRML